MDGNYCWLSCEAKETVTRSPFRLCFSALKFTAVWQCRVSYCLRSNCTLICKLHTIVGGIATWYDSFLVMEQKASALFLIIFILMLEEPYFVSAFRVPGVGMSLNFSPTTLPPQGLLWHLQMFQNSYFRKQHDFISTPYFVAWVRHGFIRINSITGSTIENEWKFSIGKLQAL